VVGGSRWPYPSFRWSWNTYSIRHGGWRMSAGHGDGAILHNKIGNVLSIRAVIPQTRITRTSRNSFVHRPLCETRSRYTLLRYYSNFEGNEHKQVTGYREASTFLLSPYISTLFPPFLSFTHHKAFHGHSILSVLFLIRSECNLFL
jgi:hypothetical protein